MAYAIPIWQTPSLPVAAALDHVFGYAVGLDMTRRDVQIAARERKRPWDMGKGFDNSAPCAAVHPASTVGHIERGRIWLDVNGETRQDSDVANLIWSTAETINHLSRFVALAPGDLIYTGTPEGVGRVGPGDRLHGGIDGLGTLTLTIA